MEGNIHGNEEYGEPSTNQHRDKYSIDNMLSRWHNEMGSFTNADFFTIENNAKETKIIYIKVDGSPSTIKGGVVIASRGIVNFKLNVISPSEGKVFGSENHREDLFKILVNQIGIFKIMLTNNNVK